MRDIPVSPDVFLQGIIDHWDTPTAHSFVLQLAQEWGYESFATELATKLFQQAGYEVEVTEEDEDEGDDGRSYDGLTDCEEEEWIPWNGGQCPVNLLSWVEYRMRDGGRSTSRADNLRWYHAAGEESYLSSWDIIAYKVID